jgi:6-phosphogluconolactonase (cycloisomerase 2 family)
VWTIDKATGKLAFRQLTASGGLVPRHFSINKAGTLAAVVLQNDGRVVIIERNTDGTYGKFVAHIAVEGPVSSVVWDEHEYE